VLRRNWRKKREKRRRQKYRESEGGRVEIVERQYIESIILDDI